MGRKRGFFAERQRGMAQADRDRQRRTAALAKEEQRLEREAARARQAAERAAAAASRERTAASAAAERETARVYLEAQTADAAARTARVTTLVEEIDDVLKTTLDVDDYIDLESLRVSVNHPPLESDHVAPLPAPAPIQPPPEPVMPTVAAPKGLFGKKKHDAEAASAAGWYRTALQHWRQAVAAIPMQQLAAMQAYQQAEGQRLTLLSIDQDRYARECAEREAEAAERNAELDRLISGLAAGDREAVEEYIGIVLNRSAYPEGLDVTEDVDYDPTTKELTLQLTVPAREAFPTVKAYRYQKSRDEISTTLISERDQKNRYLRFLEHVMLRTLHEVFEADRGRQITTVALTVGAEHTDPALGRQTVTTVGAAAVDRDAFERINLADATPTETLKYLHAAVSKDPFSYQPIPNMSGARG